MPCESSSIDATSHPNILLPKEDTTIKDRQETTSSASLKYAVIAIAACVAGKVLASGIIAAAINVMGVALAIIGTCSFFAILWCAFLHAGDPKGFRDNIVEFIAISILTRFFFTCLMV